MVVEYYTYDLETMVNFFSFTGKFEGYDQPYVFEISDRRNDKSILLDHLYALRDRGSYMVGYNSLGFDYPILHQLLLNPQGFTEKTAYNLAQEIINGQDYGLPRQMVWKRDRVIPQIDLVKVNHFDNKAKRTSLKSLQFAMRSQSVDDLPYPFDQPLTHEQMDKMIEYNIHDVTETEKFLQHCKPLINMRFDLMSSGELTGDVLNMSDVKLGEQFLVKQIGRNKCYFPNTNKPKQTFRDTIPFSEIILDKIFYRTEEFQAVLDWFKAQSLVVNSGVNPSLTTKLAGLKFDFGVGGVHASVESKLYESNDDYVIKDVDVAGMYVAVAISNGFAPEHLKEHYVESYKKLQTDRAKHPKGTTMNKVLKLAGNGVYGNSNNKYSCFYDPKYTFSVTCNGQLQLIQLVESVSLIPGLEVIQANTDGITVYMPRKMSHIFDAWCRDWENETGLVLEEVDYQRMWIRDVNNYLVERVDGKIKAKGAYWYPESWDDYEGAWNKDYSAMVVQKAAQHCMINGVSPEQAVREFKDPFDFMLRYKTPGNSKVYIGDEVQQKTVRYFVSTNGQAMRKVSPPPKGCKLGDYKRKSKITDAEFQRVLNEIPEGAWDARIHTGNKSVYETRSTDIEKGWKVTACNKAEQFNWGNVDYDYYIREIKKLLIGVKNV